MVFKRRNPRSYLRIATEFFYPRGGWKRAFTYVMHRLRRLPDEPHRIGRGVAAGVFVSFTPLFGVHFLGAAVIAWAIRGNILAALLATFVGNPATTPFIALLSVEIGRWMLGVEGGLNFNEIIGAFSHAAIEIWANVKAVFGPEPTSWIDLKHFFDTIFLPYLVGGIIPGLIAAVIFHYLTLPVIRAYQKRRAKKLRERAEKLRLGARARARAEVAASAAAAALVPPANEADPPL